MNREELLALLDELLDLPAGTLNGSERLDELQKWDSLAIVGFIALVDEHFDYTISPREFANCRTINDLLGLVKPLSPA